jgi:general stress protein 26
MTRRPTSGLDTRFSDPDTSATSWADTLRAIESAELFWLTTVRADGRPHVTPLVAVWLDDALHFATGDHEQKAHNLTVNAQVALTTGANGWSEGLDVVVEGVAERVTDDPTLARLAAAWAEKWDGRWQFEARDGQFRHEAGGADVYRVEPAKVLAFGKGTFSHTSHRFIE